LLREEFFQSRTIFNEA